MRRFIITFILATTAAAGCDVPVEQPPVLPEAQGCVRTMGDGIDPTISNMRELHGWVTNFTRQPGAVLADWTVGPLTGVAAHEDDGVELCGPQWAVAQVRTEQEAICAAGNVDVCQLVK
jgi:hypothetical protein